MLGYWIYLTHQYASLDTQYIKSKLFNGNFFHLGLMSGKFISTYASAKVVLSGFLSLKHV